MSRRGRGGNYYQAAGGATVARTNDGDIYAGRDGKTGETLLRTVLAPMFTARALRVRAWAGTNLLGGGDGATLQDADNASSKLASRSQLQSGPNSAAPLMG